VILSPTQIELFDETTPFGCERKWWFAYVKKVGREEIPQMALGTAVHATIEAFMLGAEQGVLHDLATPGLDILIRKRNRVKLVETKIEPEDFQLEGEGITGRIDYVGTHDEFGIDLTDWKTTSSIAKYAKTVGQIRKSIQNGIYAGFLFKRTGVDQLYSAQVYFQTKGAKRAEEVGCAVTKSENDQVLLRVGEIIRRMQVVATKTKPEDVKPDTTKCKIAFGCPHQSYCPRSGEFNMASLLDMFNNPSKTVNPGPAEVVKFDAKPHETPKPTGVPNGVAPGVQEGGAAVSNKITPPDQPKSDPALAALPPKLEAAPKHENMKIKDVEEKPTPEQGGSTESGTPQGSPSTTTPAPGEAPKRGRGRPPGAKTAEAGVVQLKTVVVRHGIWIGKGNFSGFKTDVEVTADVPAGMTFEATREVVSQNCRAALEKELKAWNDAEQRAAEIKKVAP